MPEKEEEKIDVEIMTKKEKMWRDMKKHTQKQIRDAEKTLEVNKEILKLAEEKMEEEKKKREENEE